MSAISQSSRPEINESNSRHMTADMEDLELMQATGCRQMQSRSAVDCLYGCRVNQSQAKPPKQSGSDGAKSPTDAKTAPSYRAWQHMPGTGSYPVLYRAHCTVLQPRPRRTRSSNRDGKAAGACIRYVLRMYVQYMSSGPVLNSVASW
jgi:hypothetical protein